MSARMIVAVAAMIIMFLPNIVGGSECMEYRDYMREIGRLYTGDTPYDIEHRDGLVYAVTWDGFDIIDIRDPENMVVLSSMHFYGWTTSVELVGNSAFVMTRDAGLHIIDVTDPRAPRIVWKLPDLHGYSSSVVENGIIYYHSDGSLCAFDPSLRRVVVKRAHPRGSSNRVGALAGRLLVSADKLLTVHDTSDPAALRELSRFQAPASIWGIWGEGDSVFLSCGDAGFVELNVAADGAIREVRRMDLGLEIKHVEARYPWLYVLGWGYLATVDISDPTNPVVGGAIRTLAESYRLHIDEDTAFVTTVYGVMAIDVTHPYEAPLLGGMPGPAARDVAVHDDYAYFAGWSSGVWVASISDPGNPVALGPVEALQGLTNYVTAVEVRGNLLYCANGTGNNLSVLDLTDPSRPVRLGTVSVPGFCLDLEVRDSYAFLGCWTGGLHIVDVAEPGAPRLASTVLAGQTIERLELVEDHIIVTSGTGTTWLVDVSDPAEPGVPRELAALRYAEFVHVRGKLGYVVFSGRVGLYDLSDIANPILMSQIRAENSSFSGIPDIAIYKTTCYISEGWALKIVDVADPRQPEFIQFLRTPGYARGVSIIGDYVYVLNDYTGVQIAAPQCVEPVIVAVDHKPGSSENSLNCGAAHGVVPVAILGGGSLPIAEIDHRTVRCGPDAAAEAHVNRFGALRHEEDVDGDGDLDLLFHFRLAETGIRCDDTKITLTGETYDGYPIIGSDAINVVSGGDKGPAPRRGITITPNPFNPLTRIVFSTEQPQRVRIAVYDIRGRLVDQLTDEVVQVGEHAVEWAGRNTAGKDAPSGEYFFRIEMGGLVETKKAMLLR